MTRRLLLSLVTVLALSASTMSATAAAAPNWTPASAKILLASTNVELTIAGVGTLKCGSTTATSTLAAASSKFKFTPTFTECTAPVTSVAANWEAIDVKVGQASLQLPVSAAVIELTATCKVIVNPTVVTVVNAVPGNFTNGGTGWNAPSRWRFNKVEVPIAFSPAGCGGTATQGEISANLDLWNENLTKQNPQTNT